MASDIGTWGPAGQDRRDLEKKCHLRLFTLAAGLVAELYEGHDHGEDEATDEDVEDAGHVREAQLALGRRLLLLLALGPVVPPPAPGKVISSPPPPSPLGKVIDCRISRGSHLFFSLARSPFSVRLRTAMLMISLRPEPLAVAMP